jgi:phosphoribosyl 1,2-cyclic phosphodiesterase
MELKFVGRGSAFTPSLKNTSAYFVIGDSLFLIDCGESVFGDIWDLEELKTCKDIYVLITHLHCDHVGSLGSLASYCYFMLHKKIHVIHPETTVVDLLKLMGIEEHVYRYDSKLPPELQSLSAKAVPVEHVSTMHCYGYLLEANNETIYYSGDSYRIPDIILADFLSGTIDRIYQDTSTHSSKSPTHCEIDKLEMMIPIELRNRVYCMHLDGDNESIYRNKGFQTI